MIPVSGIVRNPIAIHESQRLAEIAARLIEDLAALSFRLPHPNVVLENLRRLGPLNLGGTTPIENCILVLGIGAVALSHLLSDENNRRLQ